MKKSCKCVLAGLLATLSYNISQADDCNEFRSRDINGAAGYQIVNLVNGGDVAKPIRLLHTLKRFSYGDHEGSGNHRFKGRTYTGQFNCPDSGSLYFEPRSDSYKVDYAFDRCGLGGYLIDGVSTSFDNGYRDSGYEDMNFTMTGPLMEVKINGGRYVVPKYLHNSPMEKKRSLHATRVVIREKGNKPVIVNEYGLSLHRKQKGLSVTNKKTQFEVLNKATLSAQRIMADFDVGNGTAGTASGSIIVDGAQQATARIDDSAKCGGSPVANLSTL